MKKAAAEKGVDIKIGLVLTEESSTGPAGWNNDVITQAGDNADFYVIHSYYTPWNQNSSSAVILNSYSKTSTYKDYVWNALASKGKPKRPIALTEYNIFAIGSMQPVSHTNALHAALVIGETLRTGYGAALRWDLANGWDNGNDHGMFSFGNEPGVAQFSPRPAFYSMYLFRKYAGDVMVNSTVLGSSDIVVFPFRFSSGQVSTVVVNKGKATQTVRVNIENFKFGERYYTYTLSGGADNGDFSRKTYINGIGPAGVAGGPQNYASIKSNSSLVGNEIKVEVPALSMIVIITEAGDKSLLTDETFSGLSTLETNFRNSAIEVYPLPARDILNIRLSEKNFSKVEIVNAGGMVLFSKSDQISNHYELPLNLPSGFYLLKLSGKEGDYLRKIIVEK
jgi:hypothetical protein